MISIRICFRMCWFGCILILPSTNNKYRIIIIPICQATTAEQIRADHASKRAAKKQAAGDALELSEAELDLALSSLQQAGSATHDDLNWTALRALLARSAHLPHKDWKRTEAAAAELEALLSDPADATFRDLFHRVLTDGNWPAAEQAAVRFRVRVTLTGP